MFKNFVLKTFSVCGYFVKYGCIAHCTFEYGVDFNMCRGPSMEPTINEGDKILTDHISVIRKTIQKGDVVIARSPRNPRQLICKRVTGMEGDRVYTGSRYKVIPHGHVWLEGDNKDNSTDSRCYGAVPYGLLRSRVFYKIWPPDDIGAIKLPGER